METSNVINLTEALQQTNQEKVQKTVESVLKEFDMDEKGKMRVLSWLMGEHVMQKRVLEEKDAEIKKLQTRIEKEDEYRQRAIQDEISMYQSSMNTFMKDSTIRRSLEQSGIRIDEVTLCFCADDEDPSNGVGVVVVGKYPWLKLIMNSKGKDLRFWIDLELEKAKTAKE